MMIKEEVDKEINRLRNEIETLKLENEDCLEHQKITGSRVTRNCDYIISRDNVISHCKTKIETLGWVKNLIKSTNIENA